MKVCPNISHPDWTELTKKYDKVTAVQAYVRNGYDIPSIAQAEILLAPPLGKQQSLEEISEVFNENPKLSSIGTLEQYSQYLDTIFPNSKVKDIVYHGGYVNKNSEFKKGENRGKAGAAIYFTPSRDSAIEYLATFGGAPNLISAILNIKNPLELFKRKANDKELREYKEETNNAKKDNDSIIYKDLYLKEALADPKAPENWDEKSNDEIIIFKPEQIHILGSKKDIKGFKDFVNKPTQQTSEAPGRVDRPTTRTEKINIEQARKFIEDRFGPGTFNVTTNIGDGKHQGYFDQAGVHVLSNAEVGTEYHEAFHGLFRLYLNDRQRNALYKEAASKYGQATAEDIQNIKSSVGEFLSDQEAEHLHYEELMAEDFRDFVMSEGESEGSLLQRGLRKIAAFFRELLSYLKVRVTGRMGIQDAYNILKSNKIPSKLRRNTETLSSEYKVYRRKSEYTDAEVEEIGNYLATVFMKARAARGNKFNAGKFLNGNGTLAVTMYRQSFRDANGRPAGFAEARELLDLRRRALRKEPLEDKTQFNELTKEYQDKLREFGLEEGLPSTDTNGRPQPFQNDPEAQGFLAYMYADIPENWNTKETVEELYDSDGKLLERFYRVSEIGWQDIIIENLQARMLKLVVGNDQHIEELELAVAERNHVFSRLQEDPAKKLGQKVLKLVSEIPSDGVNIFGKRSFLDPNEVIKDLYSILPGQTTFSGMLGQMRRASRFNSNFLPIYDAFQKFTPQQRNLVVKYFAMANKNFSMILRERKPLEEGGTQTEVRIINPSTHKQSAIKLREWKKNSEMPAVMAGSRESLYIKDPVTGAIKINAGVATKLFNSYKSYINELSKIGKDKLTSSLVKNFAQTLWYLGARYSDNRAGHISTVRRYLEVGEEVQGGVLKGRDLMAHMARMGDSTRLSLDKMVRYLLQWKQRRTADGVEITDLAKIYDGKRNVHSEYSSAYKMLARPANVLTPAQPNSHVTGTLKQMYPINLPDSMDRFNAATTDGVGLDHYLEKLENDPSTNLGGKPQYRPLIYKILQNPALRKTISLSTFDSLKDSNRSLGIDYSSQGDRSSLISKLMYFTNQGNANVTRFTLDTLGSRSRMVEMTVPRLHAPAAGLTALESSIDAGGHKTLIDNILFGMVVQDLVRIGKARKDVLDNEKTPENLIPKYHYKPFQNVNGVVVPIDISNPEHIPYMLNMSGTAFSDQFQLEMTGDEEFKSSSSETILLSEYALEYIMGGDAAKDNAFELKIRQQVERQKEQIKSITADVIAEMKRLNIKLSDLDIAGIKRLGYELSNNPKSWEPFIQDFVMNEMVYRVEGMRPFSVHTTVAGNPAKHTKRLESVGTPGYLLSNADSISNYGMVETINTGTIYDLGLGDFAGQFRDALGRNDLQRHSDDLQSILNTLEQQTTLSPTDPFYLSPLAFEFISQAMRMGREDGEPIMNRTDGMGLISMFMYKKIKEGEGAWHPQHDEALINDANGLGLVDNAGNTVFFPPIKPMTEGLITVEGNMFRVLDKTALFPVTFSMASNYEVLGDVYDRLNRTGPYQQMVNLPRLDILYVDSARKTFSQGIVQVKNIPGELAAVKVSPVDSSNMRLPQDIKHKDRDRVKDQVQVRKGAITNVRLDGDYTTTPGIEGSTTLKGKALVSAYLEAISEKVRRSTKEVLNELGLDKDGNIPGKPGTKEYKANQLEFMKKARKIMKDQIELNELHDAYKQASDLMVDPIFGAQFAISPSFPSLRKNEQAFFGLFAKRAYTQSVAGTEMVQMGELGGHRTDGELRGFRVEEVDGKPTVMHMEVDLRIDVAKRYGLPVDTPWDQVPEELKRVVGYRIPNAMRSMTVVMKVRNILPAGNDVIVVPPHFVKLTGSDFDIDKVYIMFPETTKDGEKAKVPWSDIASGKVKMKDLSDEQLNNVQIDTIEAINTSPMHLGETMLPIDAPILPNMATEIRQAIPELAVDRHKNHPLMDIEMQKRNKFGTQNTGLYAIGISRRNVAIYTPLTIASSHAFKLDGVTYDNTKTRMQDDGMFTDFYINLYVNEALDATKNPLQYFLNDYGLTVGVNLMLINQGVPHKQARFFLNQPIIRELNDEFIRQEASLLQVRELVLEVAAKNGLKITNKNLNDHVTTNMSSEEVLLLGDNAVKEKQREYLLNFYNMYRAAGEFNKKLKVLLADNLSDISETASIREYFDTKDHLENKKEPLVTGGEHIFNPAKYKDFEGVDYTFQREFFKLLAIASSASRHLYFSERDGAVKIKNKVKRRLGLAEYTTKRQIRDIDRALGTFMITNPAITMPDGSTKTNPIADMLDFNTVQERLLGTNNFVTKFNSLVNKYKDVDLRGKVKILQMLEPGVEVIDNQATYFLKTPDLYNLKAKDQNAIISSIENLLDPAAAEQYFERPLTAEEAADMKELGELIIQNAIVTKGFRVTPGFYTDLIPPSWIISTGLAEYFRAQEQMLDSFNVEFENAFYLEFLQNHATDIAVNVKKKGFPTGEIILDKNKTPGIHSAEYGFADLVNIEVRGERRPYVRIQTGVHSATYKPIMRKGSPGRIMEMNLTEDGNVVKRSIFDREGEVTYRGISRSLRAIDTDIAPTNTVDRLLSDQNVEVTKNNCSK